MDERYDILFAGGIVEGFAPEQVQQNIARLFKANEQTLAKLFSGKPQMIKRGIDKPAAIKYKAAMQKAGAIALVRLHKADQGDAAKAPPPARPDAEQPEKPLSMAERLAALTGEAEPEQRAEQPSAPAPTPASQAAPAMETDGDFSLAPAGSDVLRDDEREAVEELDIDTSAIHLAPEFAEPEPVVNAAPPAPDVSHLSMGEVGESIPHLEQAVAAVNPDTSHLSMGDVGESIPHLESNVAPVSVDTSGLNLAPEGSDVLEAQYRKRDEAKAPSTDHLSLEN
ncbi:MAG: hypothetical protein V2J89_08350 [Halieaceae bacterium]|jgi:hypothetical protein|nr:hypothetical protein [Halieaceae bacterium]